MERRFDPRDNPAEMVGEDDLNSQERTVAKKAGAVLDADDAEYRRWCHAQLDKALAWDERRRLHKALDFVLDELHRRHCAGDREFSRRRV
jgi:hypothetical protein